MTPEAEGPAPLVQEKIKGLNELFSTSIIRVSYFSFFLVVHGRSRPPWVLWDRKTHGD